MNRNGSSGGGMMGGGGGSAMGQSSPMISGQPMAAGQPMSSSSMPMQTGFGLPGTPQSGFNLGSPQQQQQPSQPQGFGFVNSGSSPLITGMGGASRNSSSGLQARTSGGSSGGGGGGMMGSPAMAHRSNSFGLSSGSSPRKPDDPFSFISTTVTSEANKKA
eukprot:m.26127 g.26127  ORF g.26127 m.26127 type:complete len:161 (-) comp4292_c0_seq2:161-643(-)